MGTERLKLQVLREEEVRLMRLEQTDDVGLQLEALRTDIEVAKRDLDEVIADARERARRLERFERG
jgi:hypothetical protein